MLIVGINTLIARAGLVGVEDGDGWILYAPLARSGRPPTAGDPP